MAGFISLDYFTSGEICMEKHTGCRFFLSILNFTISTGKVQVLKGNTQTPCSSNPFAALFKPTDSSILCPFAASLKPFAPQTPCRLPIHSNLPLLKPPCRFPIHDLCGSFHVARDNCPFKVSEKWRYWQTP